MNPAGNFDVDSTSDVEKVLKFEKLRRRNNKRVNVLQEVAKVLNRR